MIRVIGDEIQYDGHTLARLVPGAGWASLVAEFVADLDYLSELEEENNEQEKTIKKLEKTVADHEQHINDNAEMIAELYKIIRERDEQRQAIIAFNEIERARLNRTIDFLIEAVSSK